MKNVFDTFSLKALTRLRESVAATVPDTKGQITQTIPARQSLVITADQATTLAMIDAAIARRFPVTETPA